MKPEKIIDAVQHSKGAKIGLARTGPEAHIGFRAVGAFQFWNKLCVGLIDRRGGAIQMNNILVPAKVGEDALGFGAPRHLSFIKSCLLIEADSQRTKAEKIGHGKGLRDT